MLLKSLAAIGFAVDANLTAAQLIALLATGASEIHETTAGQYRICRLDTGAEVWLHYGMPGTPQAGRIVGLTPFHAGEGGVRVTVMSTIRLDIADPLAGGYLTYLPPLKRGDRALSLVVELTPYLTQRATVLPASVEVQLLALAEDVACYRSAAAYLHDVPKDRLISPGALAPLAAAGIAERAQQVASQMRCHALVTGRIRDAVRLVNTMTGQPYWWLRLETDRGTVHLAANARSLSGAPEPGMYVQSRARLVCRHKGPLTVLRGAIPGDSGQPATQQAADTPERAWPPGAFDALDGMSVLSDVDAVIAMLSSPRAPGWGPGRSPGLSPAPVSDRPPGEFDDNPGLNVRARTRK